jgi:hypothetical protein
MKLPLAIRRDPCGLPPLKMEFWIGKSDFLSLFSKKKL